jgi:outer membrane protein
VKYLAFLLAVPLLAQPQPPSVLQPVRLTLAEAEAIATKNNPDVSVALLNAAAANQITIQTRSALYPTITGSITGAGAIPNSRIAAGGLNNPIIYDRLSAGVTVSQLITDFGRTSNLTASARLHAEARDISAKASRADVLLQVDRAYFVALRAASVLTVAQQTVHARQLVADQVAALAGANLKSGLDVSFAQVNLSDAKLLLLDAQNNIKAAYAELSNALGYRDQRDFELADAALPGEPPPNAQPMIDRSLQQRPEILSARAEFLAYQKFTTAEKDLNRPTISALGAAGGIPAREDALHSRYAAAGVNVNVPIFNGHLFSARRTEAELHAQAAEQTLHSIENRITRDVQVAWLNSVTAFQRLTVTAELLAQAAQSLDLAQARYDLGLSSIVELSQAQLNLTSAQIANAGAKYEYGLQRAVLDYQTGVAK